MLHWTKKWMLLCCFSLFLLTYNTVHAAPPQEKFVVKNDSNFAAMIFWASSAIGKFPQTQEIPPGQKKGVLFPPETVPGDIVVAGMKGNGPPQLFAQKISCMHQDVLLRTSQLFEDQNAVDNKGLCKLMKTIATDSLSDVDCDADFD